MRIRFKTLTYALKAKEIAASRGVRAKVVKDLMASGRGCVHALEFDDADAPRVLSLVEQYRLPLHPSETRAGRG